MNTFDVIYLSWRVSTGKRRIMVGEITEAEGKVNFKYLKEGVEQAIETGFKGYPGLAYSAHRLGHEDVLGIFSKRLIDTSRTDADYLLDFWGIAPEYKNDKLYLLAMTQGITQTDNFEFLAEFKFQKGLKFVTDITGMQYCGFDLSKIKRGDELSFEKENHATDENAVKILFGNEHIGYIKRVHNLAFKGAKPEDIKITVTHIINTNDTKKLFVKVHVL